MTYTLLAIEGISDGIETKLNSAGIHTTGDLLEACRNLRGRKSVATKTGLPDIDLLTWAHRADLLRVRGVAAQSVSMLAAAGVKTLKELKSSRADQLSDAIAECNARLRIAKVAPSIAVVKKWIDHAKALKPVIAY